VLCATSSPQTRPSNESSRVSRIHFCICSFSNRTPTTRLNLDSSSPCKALVESENFQFDSFMLWTCSTRTGTINTEQILNLVWSIQPLYSCLYSLPNNKYSPNSNPESRCGLIRFIWFINTSQQVAKPQNYNLLHYSTCVRVPPPLLQQCHDMTH
jgi:hypothetical protein